MKFILWLLLLLQPLLLSAQTVSDGIVINAYDMEQDMRAKRMKLTKDVKLIFAGLHMSCDRAEIDFKTQQVVAEGRVIMYNERVHIEGDRIVFNYKENTGYIYNGFVQSGQVIFEGSVIQKVSENHYLAQNAQYTACETCPPGWSFSGQAIDAEIGGYARIRRPVFRVGGVPILILPGLIVPLKSARQSGFLVPSLLFSGRGGAALSESYFWAIDRSRDLTLTPIWYERLGYKMHADYRYVLSEESKGRLRTAWIRDREFPEENKFEGDFDRWFAWYDHHYEMPSGFTHRASFKGISDLRYPRDFPDEMPGHGDPALTNHLSIAHSTDERFASAGIDYYTNLLREYPLADNEDAVHRFPELRYSLKERPIGETGLFFGLDTTYVSFSRGRYNYDDLTFVNGTERKALNPEPKEHILRDGQFDPDSDIFRTGQRLDVQTRIARPFQIARRFDVVPAVTMRETQYRFYPTETAEASSFAETAAFRYVQADLSVRTELARIYGQDSEDGRRLKHSIEPEIGYSNIPWIRRPDHPFFGEFRGLQYSRQFESISDADLSIPGPGERSNTGLQFDYYDRVYDKQVLDFGITNRLTRKTLHGGSADYRTIGLFRLWQSYDFEEAMAPRPHPWSSINALLDLRLTHFETYTTAAYNPYAQVTNISSRIRGMIRPKNFLQVYYNRNFLLSDEYEVEPDGETRNFGWGGGLTTKYLEAIGQFNYEAFDYQLKSFSYALNIRPPGKCWLIKFEHRLVVGGSPDFTGSVSFDFGGETTNGPPAL